MGGKKKTPTAPAAHAGTPDDSGGTEPEKQRSEDAGSDSDSRRREAALREADSSLHLRSREKRDDREVSCCEHIARPTCFIREACCTSSQCAFCLSLFIFFSVCYTHAYMASFWCLQASYTVSCQQGGGSTRPYFLWFHSSIFSVFYFSFHTLLFLSRERVVRNDSLIQRLGRQRSGVV